MPKLAKRGTKRWLQQLRGGAKDDIDETMPTCAITMSGWPQACGYGALDDIWDADGDSIEVRCEDVFLLEGAPFVQVIFPQGIDPQMAARMLKKMADMMANSEGQTLANLRGSDYAKRLVDGQVGYHLPTSDPEWTAQGPDET
jgi:hypothetical protein